MNYALLCFLILLIAEYYSTEQITTDALRGACCVFGGEKRFTHDFREET